MKSMTKHTNHYIPDIVISLGSIGISDVVLDSLKMMCGYSTVVVVTAGWLHE